MTLPFLDRADETRRLARFLTEDPGRLAVVYGRRRCGKSALLRNVCGPGDIFYQADQRNPALQLELFAAEVARVIPGFATARYPSWDAALTSIAAQRKRLNLVIDEFPYLAAASPDLPSVLQRLVDRPDTEGIKLILCGSSQRMMHGLVLDRTAPLYGRAREMLRVTPLRPGWIVDALGGSPEEAIAAWSVWGGVPRYWELASSYSSLLDAVRDLVLHRNGVLHEEPDVLLADDLRSASQPSSILALIGSGCHRLSEIAARLGKPAGALTRPLANLVELGYVRKDVPFGESERSSKRTLYRISDPLVGFWFRFVAPARSLLERDVLDPVVETIRAELPRYCGEAWELLARESVPLLAIGGRRWGPASRWWGRGSTGPTELDLVAESLDGRAVLVGEARWAHRADLARWRADLHRRAAGAPFVRGRELVCALWVTNGQGDDVISAADVLAAERR